jgi:predicted DNA-binding transcriptional regulator AlpA
VTRKPAPILYTVPGAAAAMGISERTLWEYIRQGLIATVPLPPATGRGKRNMRQVEAAEIDRFIAAHRQPATT